MVLAKLYINRTQKTGRNFRSATLRRGRSLKTAGSSSFSLSIIASMTDEKSFTYKINRPTCHCHLKTNLEIVWGMQPIMNPKGTYFFQIQCPLGILTLLLTYEMVANRPAFQRVSGHKPRRHATGRWQLSFFFRTIHSWNTLHSIREQLVVMKCVKCTWCTNFLGLIRKTNFCTSWGQFLLLSG